MLESQNLYIIPLYIQMLATYLKFFSVFQFWKNSDFSDFTQKCNFSVNHLRNLLELFKCMGGSHIHHISNRFYHVIIKFFSNLPFWYNSDFSDFRQKCNFSINCKVIYSKLLGWISRNHMQHISNGFCHVTFSSHSRMDILMMGGDNYD